MSTVTEGFGTDAAMREIWMRLHSDLGPHVGDVYDGARAAISNLREFRAKLPSASLLVGKAYSVKCRTQLSAWFDRYISADDESDDLIEKRTLSELIADQSRIATYRPLKMSSLAVVREARKIIKDVLGTYDEEEHISLCQFGRRASIGNPLTRAYLDSKLIEDPLTGSREHIRWFCKHVGSDPLLKRVLYERGTENRVFTETLSLKQSFAPKSYKKKRGIQPQTLLGIFHSFGLGNVIRLRLLEYGKRMGVNLNLATLQKRHRKLARLASLKGHLTTADLRAASDSITVRHLMLLFPRKWAKVLLMGRLRKITYSREGDYYATETLAGMGNGYTFPVQTLIFYAIIRAIGNLLNVKGTYSVYGDDLIYPTRLHHYVSNIFTDLGFILNPDKTFASGSFRESCGGDYFAGVDVRPCRPQGQCQRMGKLQYAAFLYKLRNGLTRRWLEIEIPLTIAYIDQLLHKVVGYLHIVPPSFPDTAGIRVWSPHGSLPWYYQIHRPRFIVELGIWTWQYLRTSTALRVVKSETPYYWDTLRNQGKPPENIWRRLEDRVRLHRAWEKVDRKTLYTIEVVRAIPKNWKTRAKYLWWPASVVAERNTEYTMRETGSVYDWALAKPKE